MERFSIYGARGTMPAAGPAFLGYGGETSCYCLETDRIVLVIDAGTGILGLGDALAARKPDRPLHLLFTHFHADHVMGLPAFRALYEANRSVTLWADAAVARDWRGHLARFAGPPFWPVALREMPCSPVLQDLPTSGAMKVDGIRIAWREVHHPNGCLAFRLDVAGRRIVVATDHEPGVNEMDRELVAFCRDADLLIADAHYLPEEYPAFRGWGHGTWKDAVATASACGASELILTHHHPQRADVEVAQIEAAARAVFPLVSAARTGMSWELAESGASAATRNVA